VKDFWELYKIVFKKYWLLFSSSALLGGLIGIWFGYLVTH
jgi:hypothetical protein